MFLIFGKGKSGFSASRLLKHFKIPHLLVDDNTPNWEELLKKASAVVVSPGIKPSHRVFKLSRELKKELIGETELAYRFWKGSVIAITGTDGKSTTTTLVYEILKSHLSGIQIGGNIGTPFSELVLNASQGVAVLEVSSFQGYTLKTFRPQAGIFLNFSPDHLDWHSNLEDYFKGKEKIFANQREEDFLLLSPQVENFKRVASIAKKLYWKRDFYLQGGTVYLFGKPLFEAKRLKIRGKHNLLNAAFAAAVGLIFGVPSPLIREVLYSFEGLPFRLQYLGNFNGVEVYNDSKSTTPNALKAALETFDKRVVLLFGGKDKGADFSPLRELFKKKVKFAVAYGENREKLYETFKGVVKIETAPSLFEAFSKAKKLLKEGDILLFSPGSASFDQFTSYTERGEFFNLLVRERLK